MAYGVILGQRQPSEIPVGGIIIWSGLQSDIPTNWQLCDGTNGTPDLRNRFVVGAGSSYNVGSKGGEATHTLTVNEMPSHNHGLPTAARYGNIDCIYGTDAEELMYDVISTNYTGGSQPHNNLPPYYALCYIMKIA